MQAQATADHRRPDRRRRAASSGSWRTRAPAPARSGRRTRRSASPTTPGSQAQDGAHGGRFLTVDYLPAFTADGLATGDAARAGLQRDGLHDAQAGAFVKAAAALAVIEAFPPVAAARNTPAPPRPGTPRPTPAATASTPLGWTGEVRNADDTGPGSSLACTFATETAGGRTWSVMQLGGTGGGGEHARLYQAPYATGYAGGDTVRFRVRVAWENLAGVRAVKVVVFHYGAASSASTPAAPAPAPPRPARTRRSSKAPWC